MSPQFIFIGKKKSAPANLYENFKVILSLDKFNDLADPSTVRRSSDNAETSIGYVSDVFDVSAFDTFIGVGSGFLAAYKNQNNLAQTFSQTTLTRQFEIQKNIFGTRVALKGTTAGLTSIQNTAFTLTTTAQHYYFFVPVIIDGLAPTRMYPCVVTIGTGTRMLCAIRNISGNARMESLQNITGSLADRITTGTTNLALGTKYLLTYYFNYQSGVMQTYINKTLEINDTSALSSATIGQVDTFTVGNFTNGRANEAFNGKIGFVGYNEGVLTAGQLSDIQDDLIAKLSI